MNQQLKSYIEDFIRDNAHKDIQSGYDLNTNCDLSKYVQDELIKNLIKLDRKDIRSLILDHAQNLIDQRILFVENQDRYSNGFLPTMDPINGELSWNKFGGV